MKFLQWSICTSSLCLIAFCFAATSSAQSFDGSELPSKQLATSDGDECYAFRHYFVFFPHLNPSQITDACDSRMIVKKRNDDQDFNCGSSKPDLFTIRGGTFLGLYDHFIFTDCGTGPDGGSIDLYEIEKKKRVFMAIYSSEGTRTRIENNDLIYSKSRDDLRFKRSCPNAEKWESSGMSYSFQQKTSLDLDSLKEKGIGEITCSQSD